MIQNLTDHYDVEVTYPVNVQTFNSLNNPATNLKAIQDWNSDPSVGILTSAGADYIGWEKVPDRDSYLSNAAQNDLSLFPADWPVSLCAQSFYRGYANLNRRSWNTRLAQCTSTNRMPMATGLSWW